MEISLPFVFVWLVVGAVLASIPIWIASSRRCVHLDAIMILAAIGIAVPLCWVGALIWACAGAQKPARRQRPRSASREPAIPGKWRVAGVDRTSGEACWMFIDADSAAEASLEAASQGVDVSETVPATVREMRAAGVEPPGTLNHR